MWIEDWEREGIARFTFLDVHIILFCMPVHTTSFRFLESSVW